jgi:hypothetical protein
MDKISGRSRGFGIAANVTTAAGSAAQRAANTARERVDSGNGEAHVAKSVAIERREMGVKIVNPKSHRQCRVPSIKIRRTEHGHVSERFFVCLTR